MSEPTELRTLLFRIGSAVYGCDITAVREIVPARGATRLPGAPRFVSGLINLRGTILTVVDLGARLAGDPSLTADGSIVIAEVGSRQLGLRVGDVMDVTPLQVAPPPEDRADEVVQGLGHLGPTVVIVVDVAALARQVLV